MVDTIIIIRHGETTSDKNNPQRGLTENGIKKLERQAKVLRKFMGGNTGEVICTNTNRAKLSASILSNALSIPIREKYYNLRVDNLDQLNLAGVSNVIDYYFKISDSGKLPVKVPSPKTVARRFLQAIIETKQDVKKVLIIVSHSVALESFIKYQNVYISKNEVVDELDYGEFVVLNKGEVI